MKDDDKTTDIFTDFILTVTGIIVIAMVITAVVAGGN